MLGSGPVVRLARGRQGRRGGGSRLLGAPRRGQRVLAGLLGRRAVVDAVALVDRVGHADHGVQHFGRDLGRRGVLRVDLFEQNGSQPKKIKYRVRYISVYTQSYLKSDRSRRYNPIAPKCTVTALFVR